MLWLREDGNQEARFTTMLDLYALPSNFPQFGEAQKKPDPCQKVKHLETALFDDINDPRFIPYIQMHEFEALMLSDPSELVERFPEYENEVQQLLNVCNSFSSPELIND